MSARSHRVVGAVSAVGAFLAIGTSAPAANADWDDLFDPLIDTISWADPGVAADTDPGSALSSLDTLVDGWYQDYIYTPLQGIAPWLFGPELPGSAVAYNADSADLPDSFAVPIHQELTTQPVVDVSIGGGRAVDVLVDTGAAGLVVPIWDINLFGLTGLPSGFGLGQFGGNLNYFYVELPTTVTFTGVDGDTVTADTTVDAVLFAFPANFDLAGAWSIEQYLAYSSTGILGIGPNALGPTPEHIPTADLPGSLGNGVLIDQANGQLVFGDNPLVGGTAVAGAPWADLQVKINDGPMNDVRAVIDSGGVFGTMPVSALTGSGVTPVNGMLPDGTHIQVFTEDGKLLYEYTVSSKPGDYSPTLADGVTRSPTVINGDSMNTGNLPFAQQPIYIDYGTKAGQTIFGGTLPNTIEP